MQARGRGQYGGRPYRDVIALTDAALARADLDAGRTALAGWSFGGYLAGRAATLTDRFRAVVSHAGMWTLEAFQSDTDTTRTSGRSTATLDDAANATRPTRPTSTRST